MRKGREKTIDNFSEQVFQKKKGIRYSTRTGRPFGSETHWKRIRTTNVVERSFGEVKRRTKGIGRFQDEERKHWQWFIGSSKNSVVWSQYDEGGASNSFSN
ncbi:MAG: hypothetical protein AB1638_04545 [Nitrospirota bacterium]